jgi:hypothetical protein
MERDIKVIKLILDRLVETSEEVVSEDFPDIDQDIIKYHMYLIDDAGLAKCDICFSPSISSTIPSSARIMRLNNKGHDLAQALINKTVWDNINKNIILPAKNWTLSAMCRYATSSLDSLLESELGF